MADIYLSAGIFPKEIDQSEYLRTTGTRNAGMVAITERGVEGATGANTPIKSWDEFKRLVGSKLANSYGYQSAKAFFDNGGGKLFVARVLKLDTDNNIATGKRSAVIVKAKVPATTEGGDPTEVEQLEIEAVSIGTWGDQIKVIITPDTRVYANGFHLQVFVKDRGAEKHTLRETFNHLTTDSFNADYAASRVHSQYIQINDLAEDAHALVGGTFDLTGGNDGLVDGSDATVTDEDYIQALKNLADAPIDTVFVPGITSKPVLQEAINFCVRRGDVFPIFDTPRYYSVEATVAFRVETALDSSYGAMYYPWLTVKDTTNNVKSEIPPSGAVAGVFQRGNLWDAPAGVNRAVIRGIESATRVLTPEERDELYEVGINPIASFLDTGAVIWGQKTLQLRPTALDRINVRRTFSYLQKSMNVMVRPYIFEANIPSTWQAIVRKLSPFLQNLKDTTAITDFKIVCDETINTAEVIDRNTLLIRVYVKPTKVAEFIGVEYVLTSQGVDFSEISVAA